MGDPTFCTPPARCLTFTAARTTPATRTRTRTATATRTRTRTRTATATATRTPGTTGRRDAAAFVAAPCKAQRMPARALRTTTLSGTRQVFEACTAAEISGG